MNIYVASSWRNPLQSDIVALLRTLGLRVYDFKRPAPGVPGFSWASIDPDWRQWTPTAYRAALQHPLAQAGFALDMDALKTCDACLLVLPAGRSASFELGWAMGAGKPGAVVLFEPLESDLMFRECPILVSEAEVLAWAQTRTKERER